MSSSQPQIVGNQPLTMASLPITPTAKLSIYDPTNKPMAPPHTSGLITPPETPVEAESTNEVEMLRPTVYVAPAAPIIFKVGNVGYPPSQIQAMLDEIANARRTGEFPQTSASPIDAHLVVEDYQTLLQLRAARGDLSAPASASYMILRTEIAQRLRDRDRSLKAKSKKSTVDSRVSAHLRSIEQERRFYEAANSMLMRRGITTPTQVDLDAVGDEICDIVERSVEHIEDSIDDATRRNVGYIRNETVNLRQALGHQIDCHHIALERLSDSIDASKALLGPQSTNLQTMTQNLDMASGLVGQLSHLIFDMPVMINQAVTQAVQNQVGAAMNTNTYPHRQFVVSHGPSDQFRPTAREETIFGFDKMEGIVNGERHRVAPMRMEGCHDRGLRRMPVRERGRLRRMMRKVLKRRE